MTRFDVTFETFLPDGEDAETRGFYIEGATLRDAVAALGGGADAADSSSGRARWLTSYRVRENYATGETENRSLHIPASVTDASAERIARMLGARE